jgi:hypothetical protein
MNENQSLRNEYNLAQLRQQIDKLTLAGNQISCINHTILAAASQLHYFRDTVGFCTGMGGEIAATMYQAYQDLDDPIANLHVLWDQIWDRMEALKRRLDTLEAWPPEEQETPGEGT